MKRAETLEFYEHYKRGLSLEMVSKLYANGLSRQSMYERFSRAGLVMRRPTEKPVREFNGKKYSFNKDGQWRKTSGNRAPLRRDMWEDSFGPLNKNQSVAVQKGRVNDFTVNELTVVTKNNQFKDVNPKHHNHATTRECENCRRPLRLKAFGNMLVKIHWVCISCEAKAMSN